MKYLELALHGSPGSIYFKSKGQMVASYFGTISKAANMLAPNARVLFLGCNIAEGAEGDKFLAEVGHKMFIGTGGIAGGMPGGGGGLPFGGMRLGGGALIILVIVGMLFGINPFEMLGMLGGLAHIFLTESYRYAPASVVALARARAQLGCVPRINVT